MRPLLNLNISSWLNPYKFWQKSFYDRIIRDEKDLNRIREYVKNNPLNLNLDKFNSV